MGLLLNGVLYRENIVGQKVSTYVMVNNNIICGDVETLSVAALVSITDIWKI